MSEQNDQAALTNAEKRALKARAQALDAKLRIGRLGVTDGFLKTLDEALLADELVKVKFGELKEEKKQLAPEIAQRTGSALIMRVGNVAVYYRRRLQDKAREG